MEVEKVLSDIGELTTMYSSGSIDFAFCRRRILELKVVLTRMRYSEAQKDDTQVILMLRELLELATLFALKEDSPEEFVKNYNQLKPIYNEYSGSLPESQRRLQLIGVNLLLLLSQPKKRATYHACIEELTAEDRKSFYIQFFSTLERFLADGFYTKLWKVRSKLPTSIYAEFFDRFLLSCRKDFSQSISASYKKMKVDDLAKFLQISDLEEAKSYIMDVANENGWSVSEGTVYFGKKEGEMGDASENSTKSLLPLLDLALNQLSYAKKVETIV